MHPNIWLRSKPRQAWQQNHKRQQSHFHFGTASDYTVCFTKQPCLQTGSAKVIRQTKTLGSGQPIHDVKILTCCTSSILYAATRMYINELQKCPTPTRPRATFKRPVSMSLTQILIKLPRHRPSPGMVTLFPSPICNTRDQTILAAAPIQKWDQSPPDVGYRTSVPQDLLAPGGQTQPAVYCELRIICSKPEKGMPCLRITGRQRYVAGILRRT